MVADGRPPASSPGKVDGGRRMAVAAVATVNGFLKKSREGDGRVSGRDSGSGSAISFPTEVGNVLVERSPFSGFCPFCGNNRI